MNNIEINLSSYNNVEKITNFKNKSELNKYRNEKIKETIRHIKFIKKIIPQRKLKEKIKVLELGSGNSKLLYQLDAQNWLKKGYGVEVSKSRYVFAENWKKDLKITNVENINQNFLKLKLDKFHGIDLFICVDIALQFLEPIQKNAVLKILKNIKNVLNKDGIIILELWSMNNILKKIKQEEGLFKTWSKFDESDPFSFVLESLEKDKNEFVVWSKYFIHKHKSINNNRNIMKNILKPYSPKVIKMAGFSKIQFFKNFELEKMDPNHDEYVVVAKK